MKEGSSHCVIAGGWGCSGQGTWPSLRTNTMPRAGACPRELAACSHHETQDRRRLTGEHKETMKQCWSA